MYVRWMDRYRMYGKYCTAQERVLSGGVGIEQWLFCVALPGLTVFCMGQRLHVNVIMQFELTARPRTREKLFFYLHHATA